METSSMKLFFRLPKTGRVERWKIGRMESGKIGKQPTDPALKRKQTNNCPLRLPTADCQLTPYALNLRYFKSVLSLDFYNNR